MEFFKQKTQFNFMEMRKFTAAVSLIFCIFSLTCLFMPKGGLAFGLDFTGGTQVEVGFSQPVDASALRELLDKAGFGDSRVQQYGSTQNALIRLAKQGDEPADALRNKLNALFQQLDPKAHIRAMDVVGSEVGAQLAEQGGLAVLAAIAATMIYIALRFEWRLAISAATALCHDSLIVLGIFAFFQIEFDLATLAAILAVVGYSLNDTIVVFDRVRENLRKVRKGSPSEIMNLSLNQTLSRTIMTSGTTLLVVLALLVFGGQSLWGFSLALLCGIVIGTYSSIYVASNLALALGLDKKAMAVRKAANDDELLP